ncbi:MAG: hypothetical protein KDA22_15385 [Phycisphaerales bacterium]|nr:hypothetical protein [Phycisphaerales bacterium]
MTDYRHRPNDLGACDDIGDAERLAAQQFIHGLLAHLHEDDPDRQRARVVGVMDAIRRDDAARSRRMRFPDWRLVASTAAVAMLLVTLIVAGLQTERSALALVRTSIAASAAAGDRAYEMRVTPPGGTDEDEILAGRIDARNSQHFVIDLLTPFGHRIVVGNDDDGPWAIGHDGRTQRFQDDHPRPRWLELSDTVFLLDSVDAMLERLPSQYGLELRAPESLPDGSLCDRISAVSSGPRSPDPQRIELWIDPDTRVVRRMELHWPDDGRAARRGGSGGRRRHADRGDGEYSGPLRPRRDFVRDPNRQPPGETADGTPMALAAPPDPNGLRPGDDGPPPPQFLDRPPDFRGGRLPPPRRMVFERVTVDPFPEGWFSPEIHETETGWSPEWRHRCGDGPRRPRPEP